MEYKNRNTETNKILIATLCGFFAIPGSYAEVSGHGAGNGGTVLQCSSYADNPSFAGKTMLADFAETEILPGLVGKLTIPNSEDAVDVQIEKALSRVRDVDANVYDLLQKELWRIKTSARPVGSYYWPLTEDVGGFPMPAPEGACILKNSVNYLEDDDIQKNEQIIEKLTNTHQAGLWVHEAVYSLMRSREKSEVKNAVPARRLTALLFSQEIYSDFIEEFVVYYLNPIHKVRYKGVGIDQPYLVVDASSNPIRARVVFEKSVVENFRFITGSIDGGSMSLDWKYEGQLAILDVEFRAGLAMKLDVMPTDTNTEWLKSLTGRSYVMINGKKYITKMNGDYGLTVYIRRARENQKATPTFDRYLRGWLDL